MKRHMVPASASNRTGTARAVQARAWDARAAGGAGGAFNFGQRCLVETGEDYGLPHVLGDALLPDPADPGLEAKMAAQIEGSP